MKTIDNLKQKAKKIKTEIATLYYAYKNPKTKFLPKAIILISIGYALSPIDLIPDFIPVLGLLDDLIILPLLVSLSIKLIPKDIMVESRKQAEKEPVKLKENRMFAVIFALVWAALIILVIWGIIKVFRKISK